MSFNKIRRTVAPVVLAVTVDEVARHLNISAQTEEDYITSLIEAATAMIEGPSGIGIGLAPATYAMDVDALVSPITVPLWPLIAPESLVWLDSDLVEHSTTELRSTAHSAPGRVFHKASGSALEGSISLTFRAGFADEGGSAAIPADLRHAILMIVGHLYEHREAVSEVKLEEVPLAVQTILNRYRAY